MGNKIYYLDQKNYERNTLQKINFKLVFYYFFILIILLIVSLVIKHKTGNIVVAQYDEIVDGFNTKALVIRDETIIRSPVAGHVVVHQNEGERVRYGQKIIEIKNSEHQIMLYNHHSGIVSYAEDGLENILTPEKIDMIGLKKYNSLKRNFSQIATGSYLGKNAPAFRIVNGFNMYLMFKVDAKTAKRFYRGELVFIRKPSLKTGLIRCHILNIKYENQQALIFIKMNRFVEEWLNVRWVDVKFVKDIYRGIVIPRSAVFTQPEGQGVIISQKNNRYKFKKIEIKDGTAREVVVNGLEIGDKVIANPAALDYGKGRL